MTLALWPTGPGYPAVFSPCRTYRYVLWRQRGPLPYILSVSLNPSIADERLDDPTIRRDVGFTIREGYNALCKMNVYAYRETDPKKMLAHADPTGPDNYLWLAECAKSAALVICAWGTHARPEDAEKALRILRANNEHVMCFGKNKDGSPKHPLYLSATTSLANY